MSAPLDLLTQLGIAIGCQPRLDVAPTAPHRPSGWWRCDQAKLDAERDYWAEIIQERIERYQGRFKRAERARSRARRERRRRWRSAPIEDSPKSFPRGSFMEPRRVFRRDEVARMRADGLSWCASAPELPVSTVRRGY